MCGGGLFPDILYRMDVLGAGYAALVAVGGIIGYVKAGMYCCHRCFGQEAIGCSDII